MEPRGAGGPDSAIMWQGRWSSRPRAWAGMSRQPVQQRTLRSAQRTRDLASCVLRGEFISEMGQVSPVPHGQNWRPPSSEYSISNRPDKLLGTHPLNWFPLRSQIFQAGEFAQLRRYLPAQPVPAEGPDIPGWRGLPNSRRQLPAQLVVAEVSDLSQVGEAAQLQPVSPRSTGSR